MEYWLAHMLFELVPATNARDHGFESPLGLEFSDFSTLHFLKLVVRGFLQALLFPSLLHRLMVLANESKLQQT